MPETGNIAVELKPPLDFVIICDLSAVFPGFHEAVCSLSNKELHSSALFTK